MGDHVWDLLEILNIISDYYEKNLIQHACVASNLLYHITKINKVTQIEFYKRIPHVLREARSKENAYAFLLDNLKNMDPMLFTVEKIGKRQYHSILTNDLYIAATTFKSYSVLWTVNSMADKLCRVFVDDWDCNTVALIIKNLAKRLKRLQPNFNKMSSDKFVELYEKELLLRQCSAAFENLDFDIYLNSQEIDSIWSDTEMLLFNDSLKFTESTRGYLVGICSSIVFNRVKHYKNFDIDDACNDHVIKRIEKLTIFCANHLFVTNINSFFHLQMFKFFCGIVTMLQPKLKTPSIGGDGVRLSMQISSELYEQMGTFLMPYVCSLPYDDKRHPFIDIHTRDMLDTWIEMHRCHNHLPVVPVANIMIGQLGLLTNRFEIEMVSLTATLLSDDNLEFHKHFRIYLTIAKLFHTYRGMTDIDHIVKVSF